ncbi:hypothetical protein ElyMa_001910900 [Elysia marginata]|uniref:Uncharacterized protein n=1 Tax=Elysia marginata TaxID=1093978 RepID=A0AAV4EV17_9GAST|nr:hypothetical protein ElyMa_001910900 [Elysia marginata]
MVLTYISQQDHVPFGRTPISGAFLLADCAPLCVARHGKILSSSNKTLTHFTHFEKKCGRKNTDDPPGIPAAESNLPTSCEEPTKLEIRKAIISLRNWKAAGPDCISVEAIKSDLETSMDVLHSLIVKIWEKEKCQTSGKKNKSPSYVKTEISETNNNRVIMLLSVSGKMLNKVLLDRMKEVANSHVTNRQGSAKTDSVLNESHAHASSKNNRWNIARLFILTLMNFKRRLIVWIDTHYGIPDKIR